MSCHCLRFLAVRVILTALLFGVAACGCRLAVPEHTMNAAVHSQKDVAATFDQVRLRVRSLVGPACGGIEQAADQIITSATNTAVRRAALLWKIEAVPAMRAALFQPDPYTAQFDSWVLCFQMADYFENGPGKASLGDSSPTAAAACRRLEEEMNNVAASMTISGDVTKGRAFAKQWAGAHPIRYSIANRETTLSRVVERDSSGAMTAGAAIAEVATTVDDLNRRLEVYSDQLVRQARWEAELFKADLMADLPVAEVFPLAERAVKSAEQGVAAVDRLSPAVERAVVVAEATPKLISSEREAALETVRGELTRTMTFIQEERGATLLQVSRERVAALKELHEDLIAERKALTADVERISLEVVDHAFWRAGQLIGAVLSLLTVGVAVLLVIVKRSFANRS